ncbi:hypothetical protein BXY53_1734 [Dichotomicrobium thermohalophilum]|uniref:Uncharacterized protein n=2 Tax=Dichotomicrobium thermohalophilum TaxID=933063 RepID=A0A397Q6F6_9HYPH|nr:hypothetical protein BXY53_1734 [Dichotomicrobium thermohalophilum]
MRNTFQAFMLLAAGLAAFVFISPQAAAASAGTSSTLTMKQLLSGETTSSLVEQAQAWRCRRRNFVCRQRWGVGRDYRRCMRRGGCGWYVRRRFHRGYRRGRCRRAHRVCRYRFGFGRDYRRCMARRGCR